MLFKSKHSLNVELLHFYLRLEGNPAWDNRVRVLEGRSGVFGCMLIFIILAIIILVVILLFGWIFGKVVKEGVSFISYIVCVMNPVRQGICQQGFPENCSSECTIRSFLRM